MPCSSKPHLQKCAFPVKWTKYENETESEWETDREREKNLFFHSNALDLDKIGSYKPLFETQSRTLVHEELMHSADNVRYSFSLFPSTNNAISVIDFAIQISIYNRKTILLVVLFGIFFFAINVAELLCTRCVNISFIHSFYYFLHWWKRREKLRYWPL